MLTRLITIVVLMLTCLTGCPAQLTPIQVSEKFWTAIQHQDAGAARIFIAKDTINTDEITENVLPINKFNVGRTVIDGENAWVDTEVELAGDDPFTIPLKTVLLRENESWKVNYAATVASVSNDSDVARVIGKLSEFSDEFSRELGRSLEELQRALPQIQQEIESIEEKIQKNLPELKQKLEEFIRQLEESLGGDNEDKPASGTREI